MIFFNQVNCGEINNLSFNIKRGEFAYIYVRNKEDISSLFKLIQGIKKPESGSIRWYNNYSYNNHFIKSDYGIVYRENLLLKYRTIKESIRYIIEINQLSNIFFENRIKKIIKLVGLDKELNMYPGDLLKHQLMRANLAQAIINYPTVLVVEDITCELDELNAQGILSLLKKLNKIPLTIIFLSSDRRLVLGKGIRSIKTDLVAGEKRKDFYA